VRAGLKLSIQRAKLTAIDSQAVTYQSSSLLRPSGVYSFLGDKQKHLRLEKNTINLDLAGIFKISLIRKSTSSAVE